MKPLLLNSSPTSARDMLFRGTRAFNERGEANVANKQELAQLVAHVLASLANGEVITEAREIASETRLSPAQKREMLTAAFNDHSGSTWAELGAAVAGRLSEAANREGFARNLLLRGDVAQGQRPRFEIKTKDIKAVKAVGPVQTAMHIVRDKYVETDEFQISAQPYVSTNDLNQGSGDLLDNAYLDAQEQITRVEDQTLVKALKDAAGGAYGNQTVYMGGAFSNAYLNTLMEQTSSWNTTNSVVLMASDIMNDIIGQSGFTDVFDPVSKLEVMQTGRIGALMGLQMVTDSYRHPNLKVLQRGDVFVLASPEQLGGYTDRGPVTSVPLGPQNTNGVSGRGWYMEETYAMVLTGGRGIAYGQKV